MQQSNTVRPIIHIGYHKTATSFLQQQVFADSSTFCLPWGKQAGEAIEHFVLEHAQHFDSAAVRRAFLDQSDGKIPVISHEGLSGNPINGLYYMDRVAARLHQSFPDARIVIGTREQRALLVSLYYQQIRQGGSKTVAQFLPPPDPRTGFRPTVRLDHFEYDLTYQLFRTFWAADDILILPMELLKADAQAYLERLFGFAGLAAPTDIEMERVNEKRLEVSMRAERFLNRFIDTPNPRPVAFADYPTAYKIKSRALSTMDGLSFLRNLGAEDGKIRDYIRTRVGDHFAASNRTLADLTGLDLETLRYF